MLDYKKLFSIRLAACIKDAAGGAGVPAEEIFGDISTPPDDKMGDYAYPCFKLARVLRKAPPVIAADLCARFNALPDKHFSGAEAAAGYMNVRLERHGFIADTLNHILQKNNAFGQSETGKEKTVCIDYSSVNIAKQFHMGHLTNTALGGSLYKIFKFLGYNVVGINHLGDYGTQFGNMIAAYRRWGSEKELKKRGVSALQDWYVRFHAEEENDPSLKEEGRACFRAIEEKDPVALDVFGLFKRITLDEAAGVYNDLNVAFDSWNGESFYTDKIPAVVEELKEKNLLTLSEGAQVIDLETEKLPPALILRSDGAGLYLTRDLAAAEYRAKTYNFDKCLYVVAYQQNLHFKQLFAVLERMGKPWAANCVHVAHGMVSMADGAMSTRRGKVILLKDVLKQAVEKTREIIESKNPDLPDKGAVAKQVGTGAVIYGALSSARIKDTVFDYDKALNFDGETGPYVMYTHARCKSVLLRSSQENAFAQRTNDKGQMTNEDSCHLSVLNTGEASRLDDNEAFFLTKLLYKFPETVASAARDCEPSYITRLITDAAQAFNKFYFEHKILADNAEERSARLKLTAATANVLKTGLGLLLMDAPEQM